MMRIQYMDAWYYHGYAHKKNSGLNVLQVLTCEFFERCLEGCTGHKLEIHSREIPKYSHYSQQKRQNSPKLFDFFWGL